METTVWPIIKQVENVIGVLLLDITVFVFTARPISG